MLTIFCFLIFFTGCGSQKKVPENKKTDSTKTVVKTKSKDCDSSMWLHVYNPSRLEIHQQCVTATGTVTKIKEEDDGDRHLLLELDPGQENLLNERNEFDKKGQLVVEIVCANKVYEKKAKSACKDYENTIPIPNKGDHIRVTGSHVLDTHNGWMEIHPVMKLEVIK